MPAASMRNNTAGDQDIFGAVAAADVRLSHAPPCRPQTNGRAERLIKILQEEWAFGHAHRSNAE